MKHKGTRIIETQNLILRPFKNDDAQQMFDNWAGDDEVTKYMTWPPRKNIEDTQNVVEGWVKRYSSADFYHWSVVKKDENQHIGFISVISCDENVEKVELGYAIGKKWWHKGVMTEALNSVIDYLFNEIGVQRIQACHDARNISSGKVMAKCGMQYEGTMRRAEKTNSGICDLRYYAVLAEDKK